MGLLTRTRSKIFYKLKHRTSDHGEPIYYGDDIEPQSGSDGSLPSSRSPSAEQNLLLSRGENSTTSDTEPPPYDLHTTINPGNPSNTNEVRPEYTDIARSQGQSHWGDAGNNSAASYFNFGESAPRDSPLVGGQQRETEDGTAFSNALDENRISSPLQGAGNGLAEYRGMGVGLDRRVTGGGTRERPPLGNSGASGSSGSTTRMTLDDAIASRRPFTTTRTLHGFDN